MKTLEATLNFFGSVHTIYVQVSDAEAADPHFLTRLRNRLECNPSVLRLRESEEPEWKSLAQRYRKERDAARKEARVLAKQYSELATRVAKESAEKPCFAVLKP
jgi:hypothetical protein